MFKWTGFFCVLDTDATNKLAEDLRGISETINHVKFTFTRPDLLIKVNMTEDPNKEMLDSILSNVKTFATVEHMEEIAHSVKWNLEISEIHLVINSDKDDRTMEHAFFARYFKTSDASNHDPENIDGYKTWFESKADCNVHDQVEGFRIPAT